MKNISLNDILVTPLECIPTIGGDVMHALKKTDSGFVGFGEVYFSWIKEGAIKAWKRHQHMSLNLVVPIGAVRFVFHLPDQKNDYRVEKIGYEHYLRLTIPPTIWFGFQGIAHGSSLLLNVADMEHDPDEVERKELNEIKFDWRGSSK